jgi:hypothetical protein
VNPWRFREMFRDFPVFSSGLLAAVQWLTGLAYPLHPPKARGVGYALFSVDRKDPFRFVICDGRAWPLLEPGDRVCCSAGRTARIAYGSVFRTDGADWRTQHRVGLQSQMGRRIGHPVSGTRNRYDAQLLGGDRSPRGARPDGAFHEERLVDWQRLADLLFRFGPTEPGRAEPQRFRGAIPKESVLWTDLLERLQ